MVLLFCFVYFLVGISLARFDIISGRDLILDDSSVHTVFIAILWLPVIFVIIFFNLCNFAIKIIDRAIKSIKY